MTCFIEECFLNRIRQRSDGDSIETKWKSDKECYRSRTSTTVFDFQHFSMHDESHSISILKYIELLLGHQCIENKIGVGDLWLLLECAYFHDIGMTLTRDEQQELWTTDTQFREYIYERLSEGAWSPNRELYDAANYYNQVEQLFKGERPTSILDDATSLPQDDWPVELLDKLRLLVTDYIRKHHAERCKKFFGKILDQDKLFFDGIIDKRLYELVALISAQHTQSFSNIFKDLCWQEIAFGDEYIHPQFVAALLRIGDVLDIDNNRFNVRVLEHVGVLPPVSEIHLKKHKSLAHFNVSPETICAVAKSNEFEVCKAVREWFNWIEDEVKNLKYYWNQIAPAEIRECRLARCNLEVFLAGNKFTSKNMYTFSFDSRKMQKLLIGDSIYSCKLDCIREYIQNAMDASKVKMWKTLCQDNVEYLFRDKRYPENIQELLPFDFDVGLFERFPIFITLSFINAQDTGKNDCIRISIRDYGIGMDNTCIQDITTIGKGWRSRSEYQDVFNNAPKWMRPTGGFGIGIQSAFMITDKVTFTTHNDREQSGHRVELVSPSNGGNVSDESIRDVPFGTEVSFDIDALKFLDVPMLGLPSLVKVALPNALNSSLPGNMSAMFSRTKILDMAYLICKLYIENQIPSSLFPIYLSKKGDIPVLLQSPYFYLVENRTDIGFTGKLPLKMHQFKPHVDSKTSGEAKEAVAIPVDNTANFYYCIVPQEQLINRDGRVKRIILWNRQDMDLVSFSFSDQIPDKSEAHATISFKDIRVPDPESSLSLPFVDYYYNILGRTAGTTLNVSRSSFNSEYIEIFQSRLRDYLQVALEILISVYPQKRENPTELNVDNTINVSRDFERMVFAHFSQFSLQGYLNKNVNNLLLKQPISLVALKNVYMLKKTEIDNNTFSVTLVGSDENAPGKNALKALLETISDFKDNEHPYFVVCAVSPKIRFSDEDNERKNEIHLNAENNYQEVFNDLISDPENNSIEASSMQALIALCNEFAQRTSDELVDYRSQLKNEILRRICRDLVVSGRNVPFYIFHEDWNACFSMMETDCHTKLKNVKIPLSLCTEQGIGQYYDLIIYYTDPKPDDSNIITSKLTKAVFDNMFYKEQYPELCVKSVPFGFDPPNPFEFAHIIPGSDIMNDSDDSLKAAIRTKGITPVLIKERMNANPDFKRLVKWVYFHQCGNADGAHFYTYKEIENVYLKLLENMAKKKKGSETT